jgi:hypothetical protein
MPARRFPRPGRSLSHNNDEKLLRLPLRSRTAKRHRIGGDDLLADRPQRDPGQFQMRPGKRNADNGQRQSVCPHNSHDFGEIVSARQATGRPRVQTAKPPGVPTAKGLPCPIPTGRAAGG